MKRTLLVGRRESCDIVLRFANVSAHHCQLTLNGGYWYVKDLKSRNGVKVNGVRVTEKRLDPGDELAVAKHKYEIAYSPADQGAVGPPPEESAVAEGILSKSLLERAGLVNPPVARTPPQPRPGSKPPDGKPGQSLNSGPLKFKDPHRPV
jgi:FHA domain